MILLCRPLATHDLARWLLFVFAAIVARNGRQRRPPNLSRVARFSFLIWPAAFGRRARPLHEARMPYGLYISAEGAQAQTKRLEVIANNLANADTVGFKRELGILQARYAESVEQGSATPGSGSLADLGGGVLFRQTKTDFSPGPIKRTDVPSDAALQGEGFFVVRKGQENLLTRAGNFRADRQRRARHAAGLQGAGRGEHADRDQSHGGPWEINATGEVAQGSTAQPLAIVQPNSLGDLVKTGENLFRPLAEPRPVDPAQRNVAAGCLEMSGTQPMLEMTALIETSRMLEANVNILKSQNEMLDEPGQPGPEVLTALSYVLLATPSKLNHVCPSTLYRGHGDELPCRPSWTSSPTTWPTRRPPGSKRAGPISKTSSIASKRCPAPRIPPANTRPTGIALGKGTRVQSTQTNFTQGTMRKPAASSTWPSKAAGSSRSAIPRARSTTAGPATSRKNANGDIVVGSANIGRLLEPSITIPQDATSISISSAGIVSVQQPGSQQLQQVGQIQLATFINPEGLLQQSENLYSQTDASGPPIAGQPRPARHGHAHPGLAGKLERRAGDRADRPDRDAAALSSSTRRQSMPATRPCRPSPALIR